MEDNSKTDEENLKKRADMFRRVIASHVPDVATKVIEDPLDAHTSDKFRLLRFRQSSHYMYPLIRYERDDTHDPMSYVTGAMTKLTENELYINLLGIKTKEKSKLYQEMQDAELVLRFFVRFHF